MVRIHEMVVYIYINIYIYISVFYYLTYLILRFFVQYGI